YPDPVNSIPSTTVGPGPPNPPPFPATPFTVSYGCAVSYSQRMRPSFAENARMTPFREPVKTAPGIAVAPAQLPVLQRSIAALGPAPPPPPPPPPRPVGIEGQPAGRGTFVYHPRSP